MAKITYCYPRSNGIRQNPPGAQLACDFQGEVISADSRQVYITMNIGTGKDLKEYVIDGRRFLII
jgi:tRNA A37 N6-isopentenylltransferase MiaA